MKAPIADDSKKMGTLPYFAGTAFGWTQKGKGEIGNRPHFLFLAELVDDGLCFGGFRSVGCQLQEHLQILNCLLGLP